MLFANQAPNLIFASPDGSTGAPEFRSLTGNDLPFITISTTVLSSNIECIANAQPNTEAAVYVLGATLTANSISPNTIIDMMMVGLVSNVYSYDTGVSQPDMYFEVRYGANGNLTDPVIYSEFVSHTSSGTPVTFVKKYRVVFQSETSALLLANNDTVQTFTVNTAQTNILGLSFGANIYYAGIDTFSQGSNIQMAIIQQG